MMLPVSRWEDGLHFMHLMQVYCSIFIFIYIYICIHTIGKIEPLNLIEKENEVIGKGLDLSSGHNVKQAYFVLFSFVFCVLDSVTGFSSVTF